MRGGNSLYQFTQIHFGMHGHKILFHHILHFHQGKDSLVLMVRQQFSFLGQTHGIDAVRLERNNGQVGTDGYDHQGHE